MEVNSDGIFRPEIAKAVNMIDYMIESLRSLDQTTKNILDRQRKKQSDELSK